MRGVAHNQVVLGRGATLIASRTGYKRRHRSPATFGFAIGRTIWLDALREYVAGRLERDATIEQIAASYRQMIDVYSTAEEANR